VFAPGHLLVVSGGELLKDNETRTHVECRIRNPLFYS